MYLWDSNIVQYFWQEHPMIEKHIQGVGWNEIALPSVVIAEILRGRCDFALKATLDQMPLAHQRLMETRQLLRRFKVVTFDEVCAKAMFQLQRQVKTRKRYADVMIAATAIAGQHIVVTRNQRHFVDLLLPAQLENWVDKT